MTNLLESQAIVNLLHLCDQDIPQQRNPHNQSQHRSLSRNLRSSKCNSVTANYKASHATKVKTEAEFCVQRTVYSTQNKQNLKKILQKLQDSPKNSPASKKHQNIKYKQSIHMKSQTSQHQVLSKQFKKSNDIERSLQKIMGIAKEKDIMKLLLKGKTKISNRLRSLTKMQRTFKTDNKITALRQIQGFKRTQMTLKNERKQDKESGGSIYNLLRHQQNINSLLSSQSSQINLKNLVF